MAGGGMPGGLGDMMGMIQKAQQQAEQMKVKMEADLKEKIVEGSTGGGMVTVTCTGGMEVRSIKIDGSVIDPDDTEMLEDLLTAAVNVALKKAKSLQDEAQSSQLGNMLGGMPGMGGAGAGGMPDLGSHLGGRGGLGG